MRRRWDPKDPTYDAHHAPPEGWRFPDSSRWPLGHLTIMHDWRGQGRIEGEAIERTKGMVLIRTRYGELIWGGTTLLDPPTGRKWRRDQESRERVTATNTGRHRKALR